MLKTEKFHKIYKTLNYDATYLVRKVLNSQKIYITYMKFHCTEIKKKKKFK